MLEDALGEGNEGVGRLLHAGSNQVIDMDADYEADYAQAWKLRAGLLDKLIERLKSNIPLAPPPAPAPAPIAQPSPRSRVEQLIKGFHRAALQLRKRHGGRPPFTITDEYDVQDLLHALLKLDFDDVRAEEWTGSYAGKSSRMDFLLKAEQLVIEVKMTRDGLGERMSVTNSSSTSLATRSTATARPSSASSMTRSTASEIPPASRRTCPSPATASTCGCSLLRGRERRRSV